MSSVLTALGVPGGTVANTFDDDAYLDDVSKTSNVKKKNKECLAAYTHEKKYQ